jgi:hypothetical protein
MDMDIYSGPERYVLAQGYKIIRELGGLTHVDLPPVATAEPRYFLDENEPVELHLRGVDFDDLPITTEILSPPEHGTLTPVGDGARFTYTPDTDYNGYDYVTYQVTNGTEASYPLTLFLSIGSFQMPAPSPEIAFMEDFDDQNIENVELQTQGYSFSTGELLWDGITPSPFDGIASLKLINISTLSKAVDTTNFENLSLSLRLGTGSEDKRIYINRYPMMYVDYFDGDTWTTLTEFTNTLGHVHILEDVHIPLPPEASMNPDFKFRVRFPDVGYRYYVDSIILRGDMLPMPPEASGADYTIESGTSFAFTLEASDPNGDDLEYTLSAPAHGELSGTAPDLTYTPDAGFTGEDSFTFTANDGGLTSNTATVTFTVRDNTAPTVNAGMDLVASLVDIPGPSTRLTSPSDTIGGFRDTEVGGNSTSGGWVGGEEPPKVIDDQTSTKYYNGGGVGSGFYVIPSVGASVLTGVRVSTANNLPERDPLSVSIEGSNGGDPEQGVSWTLIAENVNVGIDSDPGRYQTGPEIPVVSSTVYTSYRIIVQSTRSTSAMQVSEVELLGRYGSQCNLTLQASLSDADDDPLTTLWTSESGPAPVSFDDPENPNATATFTHPGTYVLRLTVNDGFDTSTDEITITVLSESEAAEVEQYLVDQGLPANTPMGEDSDLDGSSNYEEFIAQTHPDDDTSVFEVRFEMSGGQAHIHSPVAMSSNRYYRLSWRASLLNGDWEAVPGYAGTLPGDPFPPSGAAVTEEGFYRLEVSTLPFSP